MTDTTTTPKLRNARACEACRASKSRCIFRGEQTICQKCEQNGNQCVVRSKARPMRARNARQPDSLNKSPSPNPSNSEFSLNLPPVTLPDSKENLADLHQRHNEIFGDDGPPELKETSEEPQYRSSRLGPLLGQRKVTLKDAEELLSIYRTKASFFPFVCVPDDVTIQSLSRNSPFLFLAILTTASIKDPKLYHQMDNEFRRVLSAKVIVEGRKSLDYLQGILVYIAWYPLHANPKNNQSFMYLNLAIGLATDLGLDRENPKMNSFNSIILDGLTDGDGFSKAAKRAYLGCYYMSAALSMGFQKPNALQYRNLMDDHAKEIMNDEGATAVHALVRLQHLSERIMANQNNKQTSEDPHLNSLNSELSAQIFLNELQEWVGSTPPQIRSLPFVGLAERFVGINIYSYDLGLLRKPYRDYLRTAESALPKLPSHLTCCLDALKRFFEYLMSIPDLNYLKFTMIQWTYMVNSVVVLSRLTFLMAANRGWGPEEARTNVPLVMYLDCLSYRFQSLSSTLLGNPEVPKDADFLYIFKMVLGSVKKSYERRVDSISPESFAAEFSNGHGVARGHCPVLDPSLSAYLAPLDDFSSYDTFNLDGSMASISYSTSPFYHDLWATMTGNWADGM